MIPRKFRCFLFVTLIKFQVGNPLQPSNDIITLINLVLLWNNKRLAMAAYLCCGSSRKGMLRSLLELCSGPSSSSTRNPNSSKRKSGWELGSSFCIPILPIRSWGHIEGIRAEKGPPGGGGVKFSLCFFRPCPSISSSSSSSSSETTVSVFCLSLKKVS